MGKELQMKDLFNISDQYLDSRTFRSHSQTSILNNVINCTKLFKIFYLNVVFVLLLFNGRSYKPFLVYFRFSLSHEDHSGKCDS